MFNSIYSYGKNIKEALNYCKINELYYYNQKNHDLGSDKLQLKTNIYILDNKSKLEDKLHDKYLYSIINYKTIKKSRKLTNYEFKALNIILNIYGEDMLDNIIEIMDKNEKHMCIGYKVKTKSENLNLYKFLY